MAKVVFLDTSGWIALVNARDALHQAANVVWRRLGEQHCRIVFTDWIVAESGNSLSRGMLRQGFLNSFDVLRRDPAVTILPIGDARLEEARRLFASRPDKEWGLVDCASFVAMWAEGIREAFTADEHFEQAGFIKLL
jgi:predicted nucleic acid-binding protein